jgi:hypothetical protein
VVDVEDMVLALANQGPCVLDGCGSIPRPPRGCLKSLAIPTASAALRLNLRQFILKKDKMNDRHKPNLEEEYLFQAINSELTSYWTVRPQANTVGSATQSVLY